MCTCQASLVHKQIRTISPNSSPSSLRWFGRGRGCGCRSRRHRFYHFGHSARCLCCRNGCSHRLERSHSYTLFDFLRVYKLRGTIIELDSYPLLVPVNILNYTSPESTSNAHTLLQRLRLRRHFKWSCLISISVSDVSSLEFLKPIIRQRSYLMELNYPRLQPSEPPT